MPVRKLEVAVVPEDCQTLMGAARGNVVWG